MNAQIVEATAESSVLRWIVWRLGLWFDDLGKFIPFMLASAKKDAITNG